MLVGLLGAEKRGGWLQRVKTYSFNECSRPANPTLEIVKVIYRKMNVMKDGHRVKAEGKEG